MSLTILGLNHHCADTTLRSQLAFTEASLPDALMALSEITEECLILSTCNRTELYVRTDQPDRVIQWWADYQHVDYHTLKATTYLHLGTDAVQHAMRVASGLDSMVMGEPEILGQCKRAYQLAQQAGTVGEKLHFVMQRILSAAKAVRHETAIGHCPVSVAFSSLKMAQHHGIDLAHSRVLIIGAGQTAELLLKHCQQLGTSDIHIVNRTLANAEQLAKQYQAHAHDLTELATLIPQVDMIIGAAESKAPLLNETHFAHSQRACMAIDLSVPNCIDPEVSKLEHVTLLSLDHIEAMIRDNVLARAHAAQGAHTIIEKHLQRYCTERKARDAASTIHAIRDHAQSLMETELNKNLRRLDQGEDPEQILRAFAHAVTKKWLHQPSISLNEAGASGNQDMLDFAHFLFDLRRDHEGLH